MGQRLAQLAELVSGARTGEDLIRPLLRLLAHSTSMQAALLTEPDESPGMQRVAYVHDEGIGIAEGLCIPWTDTLCKRAFDEGRMYMQCAGTPFADLWVAREYGIRTFVSVPVRVDGQMLGTLCALSQHEVATTTNALWAPDVIARLIGEFAARERLLRQVEETQQQLATLVHKDPLTRLPNREYVHEALERMLAWACRDGTGLLVGFIDISDCESINARHGRDIGERFLVAMAGRLQASLRSADLLGRIGEHRFVVVAPILDGDVQRSGDVLGNWLTQRSITAFDLDGVQVTCESASVGLVQAQPGDSVESVLARADAAIDEARRAGRGQPQLPAAADRRSGR